MSVERESSSSADGTQARSWRFMRGGREWGPVSLTEIDEMIASGHVLADVPVRADRPGTAWVRFDQLAPMAEPRVPAARAQSLGYFAPEPAKPRYAMPSHRLLAFTADAVLLCVLWASLVVYTEFFGCPEWIAAHLSWLSVLGYFTISESKPGGGATLGKRLVGIGVVGLDGSSISLLESVVRNVLKPISVGCLGAGLMMMLIARRRQAFHDLFAGTVVIIRDVLDE